MQTLQRSKAEYRATALRIFAGKRLAEDQWLIEEVYERIVAGDDELKIMSALSAKGTTGENGVIQVARDKYWNEIFAHASEDFESGLETSPTIEKAFEQVRAIAANERSCRDVQQRIEKIGCSKPLARKLAYRDTILKQVRKSSIRDVWIGSAFALLGSVGLGYLAQDTVSISPWVCLILGGFVALQAGLRYRFAGS